MLRDSRDRGDAQAWMPFSVREAAPPDMVEAQRWAASIRDNDNDHASAVIHAKNKTAGRMIPSLVPGFWDKITMICAVVMPYRRDFPATTRI